MAVKGKIGTSKGICVFLAIVAIDWKIQGDFVYWSTKFVIQLIDHKIVSSIIITKW